MLVQLYNVLRRKFGFIGYFDGTGSLIKIKGCALDGHVIHSKLSWQPREVLLNEEEFDYGKNTHLAMTLFEHISHVQTGEEFSKIWKTSSALPMKYMGSQMNLCLIPFV